MEVKDGLLLYPEELKEPFLETPDLPLRDGTRVSPAEIWHFMTEEGPKKFPFEFSSNPNARSYKPNVELLSGIKYSYLLLTRRSRVEALRRRGAPLVYVQGGQTTDPYYAAGAIPMRPGNLTGMADYYESVGQNSQERDLKKMASQEEGNRAISMESCHQIASFSYMRRGILPVDLLAPCTNLRCSDNTYLVDSHRGSPRQTPSFLLDYPVNHEPHKPWVVQYMVQGLHRLVKQIGQLTGRGTTDEEFREMIKLLNRGRKLARDFLELWWSAPVPPASSFYLAWVLDLAHDCMADPLAAAQVLEEMYAEAKERVDNSVKGMALAPQPVRIFTCGSCFRPSCYLLDKLGGVLVAMEDRLIAPSVEVAEEGDPYENYAKAILAIPLELPTEERALWVVDQVRKSRAHGLLFGYHWGCNFQSAIARMFHDIIKKEAGIPAIVLEQDDLGRTETLQQTRNRLEAFLEMFS